MRNIFLISRVDVISMVQIVGKLFLFCYTVLNVSLISLVLIIILFKNLIKKIIIQIKTP